MTEQVFVRALGVLFFLSAWTSYGLEVHTWTFSDDGKADALGGEFSFKRGGRLDGIFVRFAETNKVVIKRLPDAVDCRLAISLLSSNDVAYLSKFRNESERAASKRLKELGEIESQAPGLREPNSQRAKDDADTRVKSQVSAAYLNQREIDLKRIKSFQAAIAEAQRKLDYESASMPVEAGDDPDYVSTVMAQRARVNRAQVDLNYAQKELEKMLREFEQKYPDR